VVQIKAIEKYGLIPLCGLVVPFRQENASFHSTVASFYPECVLLSCIRSLELFLNKELRAFVTDPWNSIPILREPGAKETIALVLQSLVQLEAKKVLLSCQIFMILQRKLLHNWVILVIIKHSCSDFRCNIIQEKYTDASLILREPGATETIALVLQSLVQLEAKKVLLSYQIFYDIATKITTRMLYYY